MLAHHKKSIQKLQDYFLQKERPIAIILIGSLARGGARADSDINAVIIVSEARYTALLREKRVAEVIAGHCTYEGGVFNVKYKTKSWLKHAALSASEPTRYSFIKAKILYTEDEEIEPLIKEIAVFPMKEYSDKVRCFNANLQRSRLTFLQTVTEENAFARTHFVHEIVYSVYRLILLENKALFPCNRRLEDAVKSCSKKPANILELGTAFLKEPTAETCKAFVNAFKIKSQLPLTDNVSLNTSNYVEFYEGWWTKKSVFPNEW